MIDIIATFNCGCKHEANDAGGVIVACYDESQVRVVEALLQHHSHRYQCKAQGALRIARIDGESVRIQSTSFDMENVSTFTKKWLERDSILKDQEASMKAIDEQFDSVHDR